MRVLSVSVSDPPQSAARVRIEKLADVLEQAGHDVTRIQYGRLVEPLAETSQTRSSRRRVRTSKLSVWPRHLKEIRSSDCDVVMAHTHRSCFCALSGKLTRVPLVFDMHGDLVSETRYLYGRGLYRNLTAQAMSFLDRKASDLIACVSRRMMVMLAETGVPESRMVYVTNGVDLHVLSPRGHDVTARLKTQLGLRDGLVVGYVGGSQRWQGLDMFRAAAHACRNEKITFIHVGATDEVKDTNYRSLPRISRDSIADYYSLCDVLVLPRPSHPATEFAAPTKFPEYAAMAKPIVTTPVGDAAEFVREHKCGLVADESDASSLTKTILSMAQMSEAEMAEMGRRSRKLAEEVFDWRVVGAELSKSMAALAKD